MRTVNFKDHLKEIVQIYAKAWTDELFKERLLSNPEDVFKDFGISLDKRVKIHFHFDSQDHFYINFPLKPKDEEISEEELKMIVGGTSGETIGIIGGVGLIVAGIAGAL